MNVAIEVTEENFEVEVIRAEQPVLVEFTTGWAFPSMMLDEVLEEIAIESDSLKVVRVKLDHNPNLGLWYGIRCIPTVFCFVDGEERIGIFGTASKEAILAQLLPVITSRPQSDPDPVLWA